MAIQSGSFLTQFTMPATETRVPAITSCYSGHQISNRRLKMGTRFGGRSDGINRRCIASVPVMALDRNISGSDGGKKTSVPNSNYVVPLDKSSCITRPLAEILRDLNKRIPDNIIKSDDGDNSTFIPWYHANRMLSFYAPGWCGEIRDVIFSENGSVTVVYRVTIRGSDGEAHRESTGTVSSGSGHLKDPVAAAEEIAFCRACARFGLGLYLYHEE
ncbi:DNA repair RAD52-like protein 2, chloroplastic [Cornus florida]|uniref:DNA repair RAD52-like protein 2, chloroplastic n=1 Tax=Cornus florida TaxID=4283 RepID=UPI00289EDCA5|nr:DNA repair RAD52-like protein 2, chloroplastic [Cornus florida]XP_059658353.1 DNA repair RAD52-like protein 2, chloroplastic [Cornus florida]